MALSMLSYDFNWIEIPLTTTLALSEGKLILTRSRRYPHPKKFDC